MKYSTRADQLNSVYVVRTLKAGFRALNSSQRDLRKLRGDGQGNVKKAIGLMSKTTTLQEYHAFLYNIFTVPVQLRRENTKF